MHSKDKLMPDAELFAAIFDGAFENPPWAGFLSHFRAATGADYAVMSFRPPGRPIEESLDLVSGDVALSDLAAANQQLFDEGKSPGEKLVEGRPYSLAELSGFTGGPHRNCHVDFLVARGILGIRQMRVQEPSGVNAWLTIVRRGSDFGVQEDALMRLIGSPLRSVLRHYIALERERFTASLTAEAVRRLRFGWITLDIAGRVVDCDEQGASVLSDSGILGRSASGRLTVRPAALAREVMAALSAIAGQPRSRPRAITLSREPWLDMLLTSAHRNPMSAQTPAAVVAYVHGDSWKSIDRCEQLAELFGLVPREARLALALCRGMTLAEAASEFALTIASARTYSKDIYRKTGARGLPDLVRIVMRSVLAIAPEV